MQEQLKSRDKHQEQRQMKYTDSHCHLDFDEFKECLSPLLSQCAKADIHQIIVPAIHPDNWQKVINLATEQAAKKKSTPNHCQIYPSLGIHPWFLNKLNSNHLADLALQVNQHRHDLIAIGETGIDGVIAKQQDNLNQQLEFFNFQLQLAKDHQLPVIVHHRQSHQHIMPLLKQYKLSFGGVIHAFSGSYQQAKDYIDLGFKLGIGGTITYPRAKKTINAIKRLPVSSLVLETDAPAMPLFGQQGMNNSPLKILNIFAALTKIRDENAEELAEQLEKNIQQLFMIDSLAPDILGG